MQDLDANDFDASHIGYLVDRINEANAKLERRAVPRVAPASTEITKAIRDVLQRHEKQLGEAVTTATLEAVAKGVMVALMDVVRPQLEDLRKRLDAIEGSR